MIIGEVIFKEDSSGKRRSHTICACSNCGNPFEKATRFMKTLNFCSKGCAAKHKTKISTFSTECANCGKEIKRKNSDINGSKSGLFFCTRVCKEQAQRVGGIKEIQPAHYGTGDSRYRNTVAQSKGFNACEECGWNKYPEILQVHHADRDRSNNSLDNLKVLCPNCHTYEHYKNKDGLYHTLS